MPKSELILDWPQRGIARLTLNRPAQRNALTPELREALLAALQALLQDAAAQAIVLTGAEDQFCAGGDLARLAALPKSDVAALLGAGQALIRLLIESPKPVVAAVAGAAAGGGAGLALACDGIVMADSARLVLPFNRIGLVPDYGLAYTLARRIGAARAHLLMLAPQPIAAAAAQACGLADRVVPAGGLAPAAVEWAASLARQSPLATAWLKKLALAQMPPLQPTFDLELAAQSACFSSAEFEAGAAAFLARSALKPAGRA